VSTRSYVTDLRAAAEGHASAADLTRWFVQHLGNDFNAAYFLFTFAEAFDVPLTDLQRARDWQGFGEGGDLDDAGLEGLLAPWIWRDATPGVEP
jgi:hypothetical protein